MEKHIKYFLVPLSLSFMIMAFVTAETETAVETAETETAVETAETETAVETAETETAVETAAEKTLEDAVETKIEAQKESVKSQNTIDKLTDETGDMVQVYRNAIRKTDSLNSYNQQLAKLVKQQKLSLNSIQRQIENAEETRRSIVPFINKMITTLEKFVRLDLPFLLNERRQRVSTLKQIVDFPDITLPDKYRRVMEAYQIEIEYGRTIEAYNDTITVDGEEYTVEILRVGRLLMTFQTSDGELSGIWNKHSKAWRKLPSEYNRSINQGLLIAKKQAPPELIKLPVTAAGKKL
jgi:hypothetical protein